MASLTPLSKGLIGLAVVGAMASAVWHLVLKERMGGGATSDWQSMSEPTSPATNAVSPSPTIAPTTSPSVVPPVPPPPAVNVGGSAAENSEMGRKSMADGDFAQARKHLEAAVNAGDGPAACLLGEMTLKGQGGLAADREASAKLFQLAQSRGSICFATGQ